MIKIQNGPSLPTSEQKTMFITKLFRRTNLKITYTTNSTLGRFLKCNKPCSRKGNKFLY